MASLETTLTLIGGPTVLMELSGLRLLTDPTFDEPGEYEARGIVLEKKSGPALSADQLGVFDAASSAMTSTSTIWTGWGERSCKGRRTFSPRLSVPSD